MAKSALILVWAFLVHCAAIYLFTSGFLLSRLSLPNLSAPNEAYKSQATHSRAVILIIDALRFDFIASSPPSPISPAHHHIFTLPQELTAQNPRRSFIFDTYVDPPTTTLQRIKGITTGSLPTFVDLGNNFGAASIEEDSLIQQFKLAGKKLAFMGDDTWMSVFPDSFDRNMTFPFDSFNVEDLHTVDNGVIDNLFPLLQDQNRPFDVLVGHFLGVDHVGHRVGPDHPTMKLKLQQMNEVLNRVVENLDDDTLLVVLGDHGMDRSGDHGGDGELETHAATWIYSKSRDLFDPSYPPSASLLDYSVFPGAAAPHRSIQQIDLVPTLSLLLGFPIPFNNLGTLIPELFSRDGGEPLQTSMQLNNKQIEGFLQEYRSSSAGSELEAAWPSLRQSLAAVDQLDHSSNERLMQAQLYNRLALETCRVLWARFDAVVMYMGLALLLIALVTVAAAFRSLQVHGRNYVRWVDLHLIWCLRGAAIGSVMGLGAHLVLGSAVPNLDSLDWILFFAPLLSCLLLLLSLGRTALPPLPSLSAVPVVIHTISYFSNSFTFWEDRITTFLLASSIVPALFAGLTAVHTRYRYRIFGFACLFAVCARLMSISTVCREEQQPYCHVTFYSSASLPSPPNAALLLALPCSMALPSIIKRFLHITKSDGGVGVPHRTWLLTPSLILGTVVWLSEWAETTEVMGQEWQPLLRQTRTGASWLVVALSAATIALSYKHPVCLDFEVVPTAEGKSIEISGYANAFGSAYLIFWSAMFTLVYFTSQLTGQLVLSLSLVALLAYLELADTVRDVKRWEKIVAISLEGAIESKGENLYTPLTFGEIIPLALLGMVTFFATGHQSTISSIQWKSSFLLTPYAQYQLSPTTVSLNAFGPFLLIGLAAPLVGLWNRPPLAKEGKKNGRPDMEIHTQSILASLAVMVYYSCLLLGAATSAAFLRRHLMVWKVFAPKFMTAVVALLAVDIGVIVGVAFGVGIVGNVVGGLIKKLQGTDRPKTQ
ncbi:hypothetical protein BDV98DRAFT_557692 [Pterulicium gracile]|uniref:GPI ethanolamine phosphate transferase 2 C-terminal domain-containing protein n=1 Tax=Pterulicium gracile TaxID=1884261 RepID=A0A5C3R2F1_9AGAR|nr:hypothetical protein BDV98DRAFT_557692 [Pterula gracilis]